jgi:cbb3-type cytochrome oxidase maturation protein
MTALLWLIPIALILGLTGLFAFFWSVKSGQFEDPDGDSVRILMDDSKPIVDEN